MLAAGTYNELRDRFFAKFGEEYGHLGKIKSSLTGDGLGFYFHNENMGVIRFRNLDEPDKYRGSESAAIGIDEASTLPASFDGQSILTLLKYPLRTSLPIKTRPLWLASNWDGPGFAWLKAAFWDRTNTQGYPVENFFYIPAKIDDNPDESFVAQFKPTLEALTGHLRDSRLLGIPTQPVGAMFPGFQKDVHGFVTSDKFSHGIPADWPRIMGVDWGIANPYAALWHAIEPTTGDVYTYREDYAAGLAVGEQVERIRNMTGASEIVAVIYCDPAMWQRRRDDRSLILAPSQAEEYLHGLRHDGRFGPLVKGDNSSRVMGFSRLRSLLDRNPEKTTPNWYIDSGACPNLWAEITGAVYATSAYGIYSEDLDPRCPDHALTACYYALRTHFDATFRREDAQRPLLPMDRYAELNFRNDPSLEI